MHAFFAEIKNNIQLQEICQIDNYDLPSEYSGKNKTRAILIGADPTNNGTKAEPGPIKLKTVLGIGANCGIDFFRPQSTNLKAIGLDKEDLYIQNLCRNYFKQQTTENKDWNKVAELWVKYLKEEIQHIDPKVPLLVTAEKIMKVFFPKVPKAEILYSMKGNFPLHSKIMGRNVYPLYRHFNYFLTLEKWKKYKDHLVVSLNQDHSL